MESNQPAWHCIANLGDVTPADHGGDFLLIDRRGVYTPELWHYEPDTRQLSTILLEMCFRCPEIHGALSDNRFHVNSPAWFGKPDELASIAATSGLSKFELVEMLVSLSPVERAHGYLAIACHHGFYEFDQYPDDYTEAEAEALCDRLLAQIATSELWPDGLAE